ncbi:hypothetical protein EIP91_009819 [Steccherinum ochraceum]|uniref:Uncharacterized protein n=1 Tax=Steccherinum ochraceum TaxID=92696 RepID=A0A4R0R183_9APHY|nr:hypothetical protein EIP91_009819 [Steccherinum ochraceum]
MRFAAAFTTFVTCTFTAALAVPIDVTTQDVTTVYARDDFSLATGDVIQALHAREDELTELEKRGNLNCMQRALQFQLESRSLHRRPMMRTHARQATSYEGIQCDPRAPEISNLLGMTLVVTLSSRAGNREKD